MKRSFRSLLALAASLGLALGTLGAAGCTKKLPLNPLDWKLIEFPEGKRDSFERTPSDLVVWPDQPIPVMQILDGDTTFYLEYRTRAGTIHGAIFDYIGATGYQMFLQDSGGFRSFEDFARAPTLRWADRDYYGAAGATLVLPPAQLFGFSDAIPPAIKVNGYVGRAVIGDLSSSHSPLTNLGQARSTSTIDALPTRVFKVSQPSPAPPAPPDSLLDISWDAVPGAAGYWLHIFRASRRPDIRSWEEFVATGLPSPIAIAKVSDVFVGFVPAPLTRYKLGDPLPTGGRILAYRVLQGFQEVLIRVSAVDRDGRLVATTGLAGDAVGAFDDEVGGLTRLRVFPAGALLTAPARPEPTLASPVRAIGPVLDTGVPGVGYFHDRGELMRLAPSRFRSPR